MFILFLIMTLLFGLSPDTKKRDKKEPSTFFIALIFMELIEWLSKDKDK